MSDKLVPFTKLTLKTFSDFPKHREWLAFVLGRLLMR